MRLLIPFIVALVMMVAALTAHDGVVEPRPVSPDLMQTVFRITGAGDMPRKRITGTGFLVERRRAQAPNGVEYIAVTAAHVLREISGIRRRS
jgi:hypothetical protein